MKKYILTILALILLIPNVVNASTQALDLIDTIESINLTPTVTDYKETENQVMIYLFRSSGCTHCHDAIEFINEILPEYKDKIKMRSYETSNPDNKELQKKIAAWYGIDKTGVPLIIIGDQPFYGFGSNQDKIKEAIDKQYEQTEKYDVFEEMGKDDPKKPQMYVDEDEEEDANNKEIRKTILYVVVSIVFIVAASYFIIKETKKMKNHKQSK